jgi:phage antirepressor YoqD-like protein
MENQMNRTGNGLPNEQTTKLFAYNGNNVTFKNENGVTFVNATEMAKAFGKRPQHFLSTDQTKEFLTVLGQSRNLGFDELIIVTQGGNNPGTWMHEDVAIEFSRWLSPAFAIWCNDRIRELLTVGMTATPDTLEQMINNPDLVIAYANQVKALRLESEEAKFKLELANQTIQEQAPKVKYVEDVLSAPNLIPTTLIAKDLGMAANGLNKKLEHEKIIRKQSGTWVLTAKYQDKGYAHTKTHTYHDKLGQMNMVLHLYWTERGRAFINSLFGRGLTPT